MKTLDHPDIFHLAAAVGWLELGNPTEARADLDKIAPANQKHPDVLEVRWLIFARELRWEAALETARSLVDLAPERPSGWLHKAYALRRADGGGLPAAREALLAAVDKFPQESVIPYNLSCYACQLQQIEEARVWFYRALESGNRKTLIRMALSDDDLAPLWPEIRKL